MFNTWERNIYLKFKNQYKKFFYSDLNKQLEYNDENKNKYKNGQMKLLINEIFFFSQIKFDNLENYLVLYIGSAPGIHFPILYEAFKAYNITWHLYDTIEHCDEVNKLEIYSNITNVFIFNSLFTEDTIKNYYKYKNIIFISDIRSTPIGNEPSTDELIKDYNIQNNILKLLNPKYSLLKWRCPFPNDFKELEIPIGLEFLQVFNKFNSAEMRIICSSPYKFKTITLKDAIKYEERLFYYNIKIRNTIRYDFEKSNFIFYNLKSYIKRRLGIENLKLEEISSYIINIINKYKTNKNQFKQINNE